MKILIFTASAGNGHNSAAKTIKKEFDSREGNEVVIIDAYKKYASALKNWLHTDGYLLACNHGVKLYNHFFKKCEARDYTKPEKNSVHKTINCLKKGMLKDIVEFKPDLIISTYIYCSIALSDVKQEHNLQIKTASLMLDYCISPFWECIAKNTDYMFLTSNAFVDEFVKRGFAPKVLYPIGIPINNAFSELKDKSTACKELNLKEDMFTLIIMKAGFFGIKEKALISALNDVKTPIQVVIVNGRAEKSKQKIDKLLKTKATQHNIASIGFTDKIPEYFACADLVLGKAGGLTLTETLTSGIPSLIVGKLPQQEIYNKDFMVKNNVCRFVEKNSLADVLNCIVENPRIVEEMKNNCKNLRTPYVVTKLCDILSN